MKEGYIIREQDKAHFIIVIAQSRETLRSGGVPQTTYSGEKIDQVKLQNSPNNLNIINKK